MREPDINRLCRAAEHLHALRPHLEKVLQALHEAKERAAVEDILTRSAAAEKTLLRIADFHRMFNEKDK